ncbi:hypothetical protein H9P43_004023 [Blastocladiella emersonii ATCC 22665]|nr:hypothetical protein H9P43_004023 [Blastocladiella emersonii ATCC 22665]
MSYQVSDTKKEDFRKYLERYGIVDALTKVLVGLYEQPDKPDNPLEYIKHFLAGPGDLDAEALKAENTDLRKQVDELATRVDDLTKRLVAAGIAPPPRVGVTAAPGEGGVGIDGTGAGGDGTGAGMAGGDASGAAAGEGGAPVVAAESG